MRIRALVLSVALAAALTACSSSTLVEGSEVAVAVAEPFTSLNPSTSFGRSSATNADVAYLTGTGFAYLDDASREIQDTSFGTAEIVAADPLTVRYTVSEDARWSDGAAVDAADLVLAWAANSGALNTPEFDDGPFVDPQTGRYTEEFPPDVVFFDGAIGAGLELVTQPPQLADDGRTILLHFDAYVPGWRTVLAPGAPAHIVAVRALGLDEETTAVEAKDALLTTLLGDTTGKGGDIAPDPAGTAAIARFWNDAYNVESTPGDSGLLVASGPYMVEEITADEVVLTANPRYRGSRQPVFETLRIRISPDPLESVALLAGGEVDIVSPEPSVEVIDALDAIDGAVVSGGSESRYEHLDLQFADSRNGVFGDQRVRRAFLLVVPRQQILDELVVPLHEDAEVLDSFVLRSGADGYADSVAANGSDDFADTDVAGAAALLAEAGLTDPHVCILYDSANPRRIAQFQLIAASAARAGFVVTDCSSADWQGLLGVAGTYDAALFAWDTTRLGPAAVGAVFRSGSALANFNRYANPEVDALVAELESPAGEGREAELLARIDELVWADAYGAPLFAYPTVTGVSADIAGVTRSPLARTVFWNAWTWRPADRDAGTS